MSFYFLFDIFNLAPSKNNFARQQKTNVLNIINPSF